MINNIIHTCITTIKVMCCVCIFLIATPSFAQQDAQIDESLEPRISDIIDAQQADLDANTAENDSNNEPARDQLETQNIDDDFYVPQQSPTEPIVERPLTKYELKKRASALRRTVYLIEPFANMRTGPGRAYPIIHVLERNEKAVILKKRTNWLKIKTRKDHTGWVKASQFKASFNEKGEAIVFQRPARQAFIDRTIEVGLLGGTLDSASSLTYYASYHFTPNLSGELRLAESFGNFSTRKIISARISHQMYPHWLVSPVFSLGTGIIKKSPDANLAQSQDREDNMLSVGAGLVMKISRRFLVRIEYENNVVLTTRESNEEVEQWKAGFGVYF